jgi:hypothetical protein
MGLPEVTMLKNMLYLPQPMSCNFFSPLKNVTYIQFEVRRCPLEGNTQEFKLPNHGQEGEDISLYLHFS